MFILKRFWQDQDGANAIEYSLLLGLLALAVVTAMSAMGGSLTGILQSVNVELESVIG